MQNKFDGTNKEPIPGYQILSIISVLMTFILLFYSIGSGNLNGLFGMIMFIIIFLIIGYYKGVTIDWKNNQYQEYFGYFPLQFGNWQLLPPITNVLLFAYTERKNYPSTYTWTQTRREQIIYRVSLCNRDTDFLLLVCETNNETLAYKQASKLTEALQLELDTDIRI